MTETGRDALGRIALLAGMPAAERLALAKECRWQKFSKGQLIFDKDSDNRDIMFVVDGRVTVTGYSLAGKEISFAEIGPGDHFGEVAAIDGEARSAAVTAASDCELASLNPVSFQRLLESHPAIGAQIMRRLTAIIRRSTERLMDFTTLSAHQRVCSELMRMAKPSQAVAGAFDIYPIPTQATISSRIGTTRETVARILGELIRGGIMVKKGRSVTIPDMSKLELLAQRLDGRH
ncbi:MAG: Crp/Fnr family transcriptional regulator [Magnetospirillum sp. WYHS-4]